MFAIRGNLKLFRETCLRFTSQTPFSDFSSGHDINDKLKLGTVNCDAVVEISLQEADFDECFVKGSGPGGSKVNKTRNCVELKHKETGIVVQCHETRTLEENRKLARIRLLEKLKQRFTPSESEVQRKINEKKKRKGESQRKRILREEAIKNRIDR